MLGKNCKTVQVLNTPLTGYILWEIKKGLMKKIIWSCVVVKLSKLYGHVATNFKNTVASIIKFKQPRGTM